MKAFLCTYQQRTTFHKVICQKVNARKQSQPYMKLIDSDLAAIMYNMEGDTEKESLAAAEKMADAFCENGKEEIAIVSHFSTFWRPKLSAFCTFCMCWRCTRVGGYFPNIC